MAKLFLLKVANNHYSLNLKSSYLGFDMQIKTPEMSALAIG